MFHYPTTVNTPTLYTFEEQSDPIINNLIKSTQNILEDDLDFSNSFQKSPTTNTWPFNLQHPISPNASFPQEINNNSTYFSYNRSNSYETQSPVVPERRPFAPRETPTQIQRTPSLQERENIENAPNDNELRKNVANMLISNGINPNIPILKLQITGPSTYLLEESDVLELFSRYGKVLKVAVKQGRKAYIIFNDILNALFAQKSLNNCYLKDIEVKLYVNWCDSMDEPDNPFGEMERMCRPEVNAQDVINMWNKDRFSLAKSFSRSIPSTPPGIPIFVSNSTKFTCKYEVQIDNDKDFQVARKIIGPKGCNMKRIIEICQNSMKNAELRYQNDFLKLRLRGRGSGFREGPDQKESNEPMHLCISSKYNEIYQLACNLVEELLTNLYKEYENFKRRCGIKLLSPLKIKQTEASPSNGADKKNIENLGDVYNMRGRQDSDEFSLDESFSRALNISSGSSENEGRVKGMNMNRGVQDSSKVLRPRQMNVTNNVNLKTNVRVNDASITNKVFYP